MRSPLAIAIVLGSLASACGTSGGRSDADTPVQAADSARLMPWDSLSVWSGLRQRLPTVTLPYRCELSGADPDHITLDPREQRLLNGTDQDQGVAIGLLPDTTAALHVLWLSAADSWLPMITTFSKAGMRIGIEGLVIGRCGPDPCYSCSETVQIAADMTVLTTDTVRECACDSDHVEIPGSCERYVIKRTGRIGPSGVRMSAESQEPLPLPETSTPSLP
jgi:hypothetical protein